MTGMTLNVRALEGGAVFEVGGRMMYEADAHLFHEKMSGELSQTRSWFVVDLSGVIGMSSTGLGILISAHRRLKEKGIPFKLAHLSEKVRSVLQITRLNTIFEIYDTVDDAIEKAKAIH